MSGQRIKRFNIEEFTRGWFVGDFEPSLLRTKQLEVAVQKYKKGDTEPKHVHKLADEITVIASGRVRMDGEVYESGEIIMIPSGTPCDFLALEETVSVVVKSPSIPSDKVVLESYDD